ncbi:MAG: uroporphyrinogen-III synthase [Thermoplasmata archaeon]|nr:uroporphyrinogen-III synthase [Thermoplasmata archaeon]
MPDRRSPSVLLLSSRTTLPGLGARLARNGIRLQRVETVLSSPVLRTSVAGRLERFGPFDTVAASSKAAVDTFVRPLARRAGFRAASVEFWAVGAETERALREAGVPRVRRANGEGAEPVRRALAGRRRRIVVPRSDRAGPRFGRELAAHGHAVLDLVVYRIRPGARRGGEEQRSARAARVVVAASPSAISHFRRMVGPSTFRHLARSARWVVLGPRTAKAARGHGLRAVGIAPSASVQRFTPYLLGVLAHAPH